MILTGLRAVGVVGEYSDDPEWRSKLVSLLDKQPVEGFAIVSYGEGFGSAVGRLVLEKTRLTLMQISATEKSPLEYSMLLASMRGAGADARLIVVSDSLRDSRWLVRHVRSARAAHVPVTLIGSRG